MWGLLCSVWSSEDMYENIGSQNLSIRGMSPSVEELCPVFASRARRLAFLSFHLTSDEDGSSPLYM